MQNSQIPEANIANKRIRDNLCPKGLCYLCLNKISIENQGGLTNEKSID
jgi:hypothetical protein